MIAHYILYVCFVLRCLFESFLVYLLYNCTYFSNLQKSKKLSASKASLMDKVGTLKTATKGKFKKLRKAVSLERGIDKFSVEPNPDPYRTHDAKIDNSGPAPKMKKAPSLKSLTSLFGKIKKKKKKGKWTAEEGEADRLVIFIE